MSTQPAHKRPTRGALDKKSLLFLILKPRSREVPWYHPKDIGIIHKLRLGMEGVNKALLEYMKGSLGFII